MEWLKKNWSFVLLVISVLLIGYFWYGDHKSNNIIEDKEEEISLRNDSIAELNIKIGILKQQRIVYEDTIKELIIKSNKKEKEISEVKKELKEEKEKIKTLTATENVKLLSENLSNELNKDIKLELNVVENDTTVNLEVEQVGVINEVFTEREYSLKELAETKVLVKIKNDQIDAQTLLINNLKENVNTLEEKIEQKNEIIEAKNVIIDEKDKKSRKDKLKFLGIGAGGATVVTLLIFLL